MVDFSLPITDGAGSQPPVFDCRAVLCPPEGNRCEYSAFAGNLPEVTGSGPTERDCLRDLVMRFKAKVQSYHESGEPIPWTDPPIAPEEGQQQRWIPVHL